MVMGPYSMRTVTYLKESFWMDNVFMPTSNTTIKISTKGKWWKISFMEREHSKISLQSRKDYLGMGTLFLGWLILPMAQFMKVLYKMDKNLEKVLSKDQTASITQDTSNTTSLTAQERSITSINQPIKGSLKMVLKMVRVIWQKSKRVEKVSNI